MLKTMKVSVWAGIVLVFLSMIFLAESFAYEYTGDFGPGPGFFPTWLSGILLVLSLVYLYQSVRSSTHDGDPMPSRKAQKKILIILGCMALYLILLPYLGFVLSSTVFLFLLLFKGYKWYTNLLISVAASLILFVVFDQLLGVQLPVNGLGF